MFTVSYVSDAASVRDTLPPEALNALLDLQSLLETSPESGQLLPGRSPTANFRTHAFGTGGMATYVIDERGGTVLVISLMWF